MSKHKIKKFISIMLTLALTGIMVPCGAENLVPVTNLTFESKPSSDGFGDDVSWQLDTPTKELTISGTGVMSNYDDGTAKILFMLGDV